MLKLSLLNSFLAGILASLNPTKSEHDFIIRPWVETLGCVQSPQQRNRG